MVKCGSEAGTPDHRIDLALMPLRPDDSAFSEGCEGRLGFEHPAVARLPHRLDHHDVAEPKWRVWSASLLKCTVACSGLVEEIAPVDVVRQKGRRLLRHPGHLCHSRDLREDLRARVSASDNEDAFADERCRRAIVCGMELSSREAFATPVRRDVWIGPASRGADHRFGAPFLIS